MIEPIALLLIYAFSYDQMPLILLQMRKDKKDLKRPIQSITLLYPNIAHRQTLKSKEKAFICGLFD